MPEKKSSVKRKSHAYWNPYLVGMGIGFLIVLSFMVTGRGAGVELKVENPFRDLTVLKTAGICIGGVFSGIRSHRFRFGVNRGPQISSAGRLLLAFAGGILMAFGAKIARICTGGQVLSGGSVLSPGAWIFMISVFIGGYAIAIFLKRAWT